MILEEYSFKKEVKESKVCIELPKEWVGRMVEIVVKPINLLKIKAINDELSNLISGLNWVSETDEPLYIIVDHRLPNNVKLEKWLIKNFDLKQPIEATTIDFFFKNVIFQQDWHNEQEKETVKKYQRIYQIFKEEFEETTVLRSGDFEKTILIVGKMQESDLVILKTKSIES